MRVMFYVQAGRLFATGLCLLTLVTASGCGWGEKTGTVAGTVTVGGTPLAVGFVNFEDPARGFGASASVKDGVYSFDAPLNIGNYKVFVQPPSLVPSAVPAAGRLKDAIPTIYLQSGTSPLTATVAEGSNKFDLKLEK